MKSFGDLELQGSSQEDKAVKIIGKNSTSKLLSKAALKRKTTNFKADVNDNEKNIKNQYLA